MAGTMRIMEPILMQLLDRYTTKTRIARELGVSRITVHNWFKAGKLPELWHWRLQAGFPPPAAARAVAPPATGPGGPVVDAVEQ